MRAAVSGLVLACACQVGPTYERPSVVTPPAFADGTWRPARPKDAARKGKWWTVFGDPELDALEERLEAENQPIAAAYQTFMAARAQVEQARAGLFPTLTLGAGVTRSAAASGSAAPGPVTSFSVPVDASWTLDLWGRVRNAVSASRFAAEVSAADLVNVRLTQEASLATYFFELRGQDALAELYERTIRTDKDSLELARAQFETGVGPEIAVAQAMVTLENAQAAAIALGTARAAFEHAIATLVGTPASSFSLPHRAKGGTPPSIPVGVPSDLLQRRPDVAAAERTLAQANALIGFAEAAYYPSVTLTASGALAASTLGALFSAPSFVWSLGASASETVFDGGLRRAVVAQYEALYKADVATYRQTVLTAFQQVEDQLATLRNLSQELAEQELATQAARRYLELALSRYITGVAAYLDVITAQTLLLGTEQAVITLHVNGMTASVALVQALGGAWL
jgi:NodT family efflux transporter outer membrane factor (OMF) lipoprotein